MNDFFSIKSENIKLYNHNFSKKTVNLSLSILFILILIAVYSLIIISPLDYFIKKILHFESIKYLIKERQTNVLELYPIYLIAFIGPLIEEILFRLALQVNKLNVSIFLGMLFYKIIGGQITTFDIHNPFYLYCILLSIAISIVSYYYFPKTLLVFLNQRKYELIIISIVLFGLMHIFTIGVLHWQLALFYPFYVFPQMIMGYFISNLRLKYGFIWGLLLHILLNSIVAILFYL